MNIDNTSVNTGVICEIHHLRPTLAFMGEKKKLRKKLSAPDELAAKNLRRIWDEKKEALHLTQDKAADFFGFKTQAAISHYLRGYTPLNTDAILRFADLLKVAPEEIRPDIHRLLNAGLRVTSVVEPAPLPVALQPSISVPRLANTASMGPGNELATHDHVIEQITLTEQWVNGLTSRASFTRLRIIAAIGDSMEPTLLAGDFVLVDTGLTTVDVSGIFVLRANDRLYIKRIRQRMDGVFEVSSDNKLDGPPEELSGKHKINVVGRVIYAWNGKKF